MTVDLRKISRREIEQLTQGLLLDVVVDSLLKDDNCVERETIVLSVEILILQLADPNTFSLKNATNQSSPSHKQHAFKM